MGRFYLGASPAGRAVAIKVVHPELARDEEFLARFRNEVAAARAMEGTHLTATGIVVGTPGYMSPEQAEGREAGTPSDVFSMACVLAFAATGKQPFGTGNAATVLFRVVRGDPELTGVPPRLREVLETCLRKDPGARPPLSV